jgi:hypothetical protein
LTVRHSKILLARSNVLRLTRIFESASSYESVADRTFYVGQGPTTQQATAKAAPDLLKKLKESGYKVIQVVGKTPPPNPKKEYVEHRAQGDGRRSRNSPSNVERDQDHRRQLI